MTQLTPLQESSSCVTKALLFQLYFQQTQSVDHTTVDIHPFWYQNNKPYGLRDSQSRSTSYNSESLHSYSSESSDLKKPVSLSFDYLWCFQC